MIRDLLRPKALVSHVLVLSVVVGCVLLGQWQLQRLDAVRTSNALVEQRLTADPRDFYDLVDAEPGASVDVDALEYVRVEMEGVYRPEDEVLQRNRSFHGQTGFHVLTPMELTDGHIVLVRRGWVPADLDEPPVAEAAPPEGVVQISGVFEAPVEQPGFGAQDPDDGVLKRVFHTDTARLDRQVDGPLFPMVMRIDTEPSPGATRDDLPFPPGSPILDESNHFSYAMQWHAFGLLALVTYGAWLWKNVRRRGTDAGATPHIRPDHPAKLGAPGP